MKERRSHFPACVIFAFLTVLGGCDRPTYDPAKLKAIKAEAEASATSHPIEPPQESNSVPKDQLPEAIASVQPEFVIVHRWGVDIATKPYFDGGWGYQIARKKSDLPMPEECYSELYPGVFWHGPC